MGLTLRGNEKLPHEIVQDKQVVKIASGNDHVVFLTNHGEIFTCGCAEQGQLGRTSKRGSGRDARSGAGKGQIGIHICTKFKNKLIQKFQPNFYNQL